MLQIKEAVIVEGRYDKIKLSGLVDAVILVTNGFGIYKDDELRKLLSGHLCRCTGYENIFRAVKKTMYRRLGKEIDFA